MRIFSWILLVGGYCGYGQSTLSFEISSHDFGDIREQDGNVDHTFTFVNSSQDTLWITNVKASCGCTTPNWTRGQIAPGDSGIVTARYNPHNRPGPFKKWLNVRTNQASSDYLYITGNVLPKPRTIEDDLPVLMGGMRIKYKSLNMGRVTTEGVLVREFDVYNASDSTFSFLMDEIKTPPHIKVEFKPENLKQGEKGFIRVSYDPIVRAELGYVIDRISFVTTERQNSIKELNIIATIEEYFSPISDEEMANAPRLVFDKKVLDFGRLNSTTSSEVTLTLTNTGKTALTIRDVKTNCDCIFTTLQNEDIKPGNTTSLMIRFDPNRRRGRQYKTVTVFSNDPVMPTQVISVKAEIK